MSGRAALGQLGIGRRYTGATNLLRPYPLALLPAPLPDFAHLRAQAQQLQGQLDQHDRHAALADTLAASAPTLPQSRTPAEAGYPVPFLRPADPAWRAQQARQRFLRQKLAEVNALARVVPFSPALLLAMRSPFLDMRVKVALTTPGGPDDFMPTSFWRSQNPYNDPKVGWALCCATVKAMMESFYGKGKIPNDRYDLVQEHRSDVWAHGLRARDGYVAAPDAARAARGLALLDQYMALHKPVMVGVSHKLDMLFSSKNKQTGVTSYREINDGTIDHFVAIVGTGEDKKGKYYRFFDVGTTDPKRGTDERNRLYLSTKSGFHEGTSQAMPGKTYVLTQLRFF